MFAAAWTRMRPGGDGGRRPALLAGLALVPALLAAAPAFGPVPVQDAAYEYQVKAVFLYNFTRYLQWPEEPADGAFAIVVLGRSDILGPLEEIARKKPVGSTPIVVRQCFDVEAVGRPRILFIAKSAADEVSRVLEKTRGTDILTVGEADGLGSRGVAVNFVLRDETIKFEMNESALREARIQVGSQLLKLAILVGKENGGGGR